MGTRTAEMRQAKAALMDLVPKVALRFEDYYRVSSWKWTCYDGKGVPAFIPVADQIACSLVHLITSLPEDGYCVISSGGLSVWIEGNECGISFEDDMSIDLGNID